MIDLKALRENPDLFRNSQKARGEDPAIIDQLLKADDERRVAISELKVYVLSKTHYLKRLALLKGMKRTHFLRMQNN